MIEQLFKIKIIQVFLAVLFQIQNFDFAQSLVGL